MTEFELDMFAALTVDETGQGLAESYAKALPHEYVNGSDIANVRRFSFLLGYIAATGGSEASAVENLIQWYEGEKSEKEAKEAKKK